jgi:pseudouridine kinase
MNYSLTVPGVRSSTYLAIMDSDGDMNTALSDLSVIEYIDEDYLKSRHSLLSDAAVIVADTNLSREALGYLTEKIPGSIVCIDAVSSTKAEKCIPLIEKIHTLKMNRIEAERISGLPAETDEEVRICGRKIFGMGARRIFITMGHRGVYWRNKDGEGICPPQEVSTVNTTGAGDAFTAGIALATMYGFEIQRTLSIASAIASLTISGEETVNPLISRKLLSELLDVEQNQTE